MRVDWWRTTALVVLVLFVSAAAGFGAAMGLRAAGLGDDVQLLASMVTGGAVPLLLPILGYSVVRSRD